MSASRKWPLKWAAIGFGGGVVAFLSFAQPIPQKSQPGKLAPISMPPIATYLSACSRCHGVDGSSYSDSFFKIKDWAYLKKEVSDMAEGPGSVELKGADLDAEVAYHRAMIAKVPFVCVTQRNLKNLKGEVSDGSNLYAVVSNKKVPVKVVNGQWSMELSSKVPLSKLMLIAIEGKAKTTLKPNDSSFSLPPHQATK